MIASQGVIPDVCHAAPTFQSSACRTQLTARVAHGPPRPFGPFAAPTGSILSRCCSRASTDVDQKDRSATSHASSPTSRAGLARERPRSAWSREALNAAWRAPRRGSHRPRAAWRAWAGPGFTSHLESRLGSGRPGGSLDPELLGVLPVQPLPSPILHRLATGDAADGRAGQQVIQHIEADVPPGCAHGNPAAVDAVPERSAACRSRRLPVPIGDPGRPSCTRGAGEGRLASRWSPRRPAWASPPWRASPCVPPSPDSHRLQRAPTRAGAWGRSAPARRCPASGAVL